MTIFATHLQTTPAGVNENAANDSKRRAAEIINFDDNAPSFYFWPWEIQRRRRFHFTRFVTLVNLKPVAEGHLLIVPRRIVFTIHELTSDEMEDWGVMLQRTVRGLKSGIQTAGASPWQYNKDS